MSYIEYIWWFVESIVILPVPNFWFGEKTELYDYSTGYKT